MCIGFKYLRPPPLPSNHVNRQIMFYEVVTKLLQATNDPNKYGTTLTITGAGGFGKTTTVISLCHHPIIKEQFSDGFVFIKLGPQATDPNIKLRAIYNLLTDEQCDIDVVEQKINQLTIDYCRNLLVIIDDVWHVEDAEPLVKAFSNCKIILTTRMNDIEQYIPSKQSVVIGPMMEDEAISLLTSGVIDSSQLSQEDMSLLNEISQDVHLWPLLLSLIRGQLSHNLKQCHLSYHKAIENVQAKLHHRGLTAFDKKNIETVNKSRNLAVKVCIEMTLDLLTKMLSDIFKSLILWTGIGTLLQRELLSGLWTIPEQEAEDTVNILWAYGLVKFTIIPSSSDITQHCVEVHSVISQYIIESFDSNDIFTISPHQGKLDTSMFKRLRLTHQQSYGVHNPSSLTPMDYLKFKLSEIEICMIPFHFKAINSRMVTDPHVVIVALQQIKDALRILQCATLHKEINSLIDDCKNLLNNAHKLSRKLNQKAQQNIFEKSYDKLIQTVEEFIKNYPLCEIAQKAVTIVKKIIPYCDGEVLHNVNLKCEDLIVRTIGYHSINTHTLSHIKFFLKLHKQISSSLLKGLPDIEQIYHYFKYGKDNDELKSMMDNRLTKLREVAPYRVQEFESQISHALK